MKKDEYKMSQQVDTTNYKEKYKEALKVIESLYNVVKYQSSSDALLTSQTIEKAFPELKESNDERIRKRLIEIAKIWKNGGYAHGYSDEIDDILYWLKKQGKIADEYEDKLDRCACESFDKGYKAALEKQGEQNPAWSEEDEEQLDRALYMMEQLDMTKSWDDVYNWLKSLKDRVLPQPKQEWSEEDERILNKIQDHLREFYVDKKGYPYVAEPDSPEVMEKNWLQSFKDRVQPQSYQGWSEKDEYILKNIHAFIKENTIDPNRVNCAEECLNWLKSLKPNHWKPTEEQIEIIDMILTNESMDDNVARILRELKEQLEKL